MRSRVQARRRGAAIAVAISLSIHAAILAALLLLREAPRRSAPLEVRLVRVAPPPTPPATAPPTATATAPPTATATPTPTATATATATPTPTPTPPAPATATVHADDSSSAPASPGAGPLTEGHEAPRFPPAALVTPIPRELRPEAPDRRRETNEVLAELLASARAADLARQPDTSWMELRDRLVDGFAPGFEVLDEDGGAGAASFLADAAVAYAASAARYGGTGLPFESSADAPGRAAASKEAALRAGAEGSREREALLSGVSSLAAGGNGGGGEGPPAWTRRLVTVVAVEQDAAGAVIGARVASPSGSRAHDRLAVAQALRLVGQVVGVRLASSTTEWLFATDFSVIPPVPVVGVGFDANFRPTGAVYPLKRSTRAKVQLVAVRRAG